MPTQTPRDNEHRLHVAVVAVAAIVAVAMVAAAGWAVTRPRPSAEVPMLEQTPGEETSQSTTPATSSAGGVSPDSPGTIEPTTSKPGTSTDTTRSGSPSTGFAGRIAFHIGKSLYIAFESGKTITPMHVVGTNYALSPDGRTVAAVEKGRLMVAKVGDHLLASSPVAPDLTAEAVAPVWSPDSSGFFYVRANSEGLPRVWRYDRLSGGSAEIGIGSEVAMSPDGKTIAALPTEETESSVVSVMPLTGGSGTTFKVPSGDPVAIALSRSRIFVSCVSAAGSATIWSFEHDGSDKHKIVAEGAAGGTSVTYGELMVSPDGYRLLFAADGDDGYSRLFVVPAAGGTITKISGRRDGYALRWTRDGTGVLFIEGNAFQGQSTSLLRSDLTGHRRTTLVKGAAL